MKLASTTCDFARYNISDKERIKYLADAGFKYIDFDFYSQVTTDSEFYKDTWKQYTYDLREYGEKLGVKFVQAHAPNSNPLQQNGKDWDVLLQITKNSIEACEILGIKNNVYHAGWDGPISTEEYYKRNLEFLQLLMPIMEKTGVTMLVENSTKVNMTTNRYFITGKDMSDFIEYVNHPLVAVCWDTGHANCEGNQYKEIIDLGKNLKGLHVNDNRGERDEHLLPYCGTTNFDEVIKALIDIKYDGYFTFECCSTLRPAKYWLGNRREFADSNIICDPTVELDRKHEVLLYMTGKHMLSSYGIFEE